MRCRICPKRQPLPAGAWLARQEREGGRGPVGDPMIFGPVVINGLESLPRLSRKIPKLHYTQTLQVIVPPIEPPPKRRRELPVRHHRPHDVETFGRFNSFIQ